MAYTLFAPSKRVRPVLTLLSAELCGGTASHRARAPPRRWSSSTPLAHPRRPARDGRRGAAARAAGQPPRVRRGHRDPRGVRAAQPARSARSRAATTRPAARLAALLDEAVGNDGLIAGQAADLLATEQEIGFDLLERIHRGKTGALFNASAVAGALTAGADVDAIAALSAFAKNLGLAFQIIDDLLDVEGDPAETGKAMWKDARKTTFVSFSGVAGAHQLAGELCQTADRALAPFGRRADKLRELSAFVAGRSV